MTLPNRQTCGRCEGNDLQASVFAAGIVARLQQEGALANGGTPHAS